MTRFGWPPQTPAPSDQGGEWRGGGYPGWVDLNQGRHLYQGSSGGLARLGDPENRQLLIGFSAPISSRRFRPFLVLVLTRC